MTYNPNTGSEKKINASPYGFTPVDNAIIQLYLRLPTFTYAELAFYTYLVGNVQNKDFGNGKQGYMHRSKARIKRELSMGGRKLDATIDNLISLRLIDVRAVPNNRGGWDKTEFRPLPIPVTTAQDFLRTYGAQLDEIDRQDLAKKTGGTTVPSPVEASQVDELARWL